MENISAIKEKAFKTFMEAVIDTFPAMQQKTNELEKALMEMKNFNSCENHIKAKDTYEERMHLQAALNHNMDQVTEAHADVKHDIQKEGSIAELLEAIFNIVREDDDGDATKH